MTKKESSQSGVLIIEASLVLPVFLFMFMTFYGVLNVCLIQVRVQSALTNAAREISEYSYLYSFSGAKDFNDGLKENADAGKEDISKNVIDNFSTIMSSIENVKSDGKGAYQEVTSGDFDLANIETYIETYKNSLQSDAKEGVDAGKAIYNYIKTNLTSSANRKAFLQMILQIFASDGLEIFKGFLGEFIAEQLCEDYIPSGINVDYSKSMLFPGTSADIILVAEYEIDLISFLPVDITYTLSQQAVTKGWLDGDGGKPPVTATPTPKPEKEDNIWTKKNNITDRAKYVREKVEEKLSSVDYITNNGSQYYELNNSMLHLCNPTTNTYTYVGSSNPLYSEGNAVITVSTIDSEAVKKNYLDMIYKLDTYITSIMRYKVKSGSGNVIVKSISPYNYANDKKIPVKKEIYLVIPEDSGLDTAMLNIWNSLTEDEKKGVTLKIEQAHGSYYKETN